MLGNTQQTGEQGLNAARVDRPDGRPAGRRRAGRRSIASAAAACRPSTRRRTRSPPASRTCRSSAAWSTCTTCRWTTASTSTPSFSADEQGGADDGHHGRVPGPDAGHLAAGAGRVRPAQPPAGRGGACQGRVPARDRSRLWPRRRRASAFSATGDQCVRPDASLEALAALEPAFMPRSAPSRPATARRSTTARRRC